MPDEPLKLYLWKQHQCDWSCGVAFALARSEGEARELIRGHEDNYSEPEGPPEVIDGPFGFSRSGGG